MEILCGNCWEVRKDVEKKTCDRCILYRVKNEVTVFFFGGGVRFKILVLVY